jgi:hypothetical protein
MSNERAIPTISGSFHQLVRCAYDLANDWKRRATEIEQLGGHAQAIGYRNTAAELEALIRREARKHRSNINLSAAARKDGQQ